ncbi:MAG: T9SS type A sorting domain-containing protein, partial [Candidatus Delongbacteria bacterium]|nr:T9SS type A sorting domain-containing protein [Candidatus Delongbacteria bacterium]
QVFDMLGREVALLVNEWQSAGFHEVQFDLRTVDRELSSGIYLCRLQMGKQVTSRRITLVK